jgi:hypothetical protein
MMPVQEPGCEGKGKATRKGKQNSGQAHGDPLQTRQ